MGKILPFEINAINYIALKAKNTSLQDKIIIQDILNSISYENIDIDFLVNQLLFCCDITLNFHPDRFSNNGKLIIDNLIKQGQYHSQFITGITNGGRTAFPGGERDVWEKNLFGGSYHGKKITVNNRPKYGALNIFNYLDGASSRFGSCFFTLNAHVVDRCTFAYGDSSTNPESMGTSKAFYPILRAMLVDVRKTGNFLNKKDYGIKKTIDYIMSMKRGYLSVTGKNLDYCIEAHIHGEVNLLNDVDCLFIDESFSNTEIHEKAIELSDKYNIKLFWIPERRILVDSITDEFRGQAIPPLAKKIALELGNNSDYINAALIGKASRFSMLNPSEWSDLGNEHEIFQYLKQLWHTVAYFG